MDLLKAKTNHWKLLSLLIMSIFLISCLEKGQENEEQISKQEVGETIYVTLTSSESRSTGRYLGTYGDVDGVLLKYERSDGIGVPGETELSPVVSNYGGATTTMQWTGALNNVIAGARYDFEAIAYRNGYECLAVFYDEATNTYIENPDYTWSESLDNMCRDLEDADPVEQTGIYGHRDQYKANIFNGEKNYHKLEVGNNNLQLRMSPILKPAAQQQMIPYISKIIRPEGYGAGDELALDVEFKGPQGFMIGLIGKVTGTCSEESAEECTDINEFVIVDQWDGGDVLMRLCPGGDDTTFWWEVECGFEDVTITQSRSIEYIVPANPPAQLRFEFVINLKNTVLNEEWGYTEVRGDLGLSNTIWFDLNRNSLEQTSEFVFMPTVQDISVYFDMSSETADLSYALQTQGVTNDIEIFANLEYTEKTPLGFPSPYLKLVNTGSATGTQTLYGRMDKNELYIAKLNLNFVHTPSGFDFVADYPLPKNNKPKFGESDPNWETFKTTGQCEHCQFVHIYEDGDHSYSNFSPQHVGESICGERDGYEMCEGFYTEWNTDEDPWLLNTPIIDGGSLAYANLAGFVGEYDSNYSQGSVNYLQIKNTSFLGTNLTGFKFNYMDLNSSQFVNSQINKTVFKRSKLDNVLFTSNDGLPTTQNLPYTNLKFDMSSGNQMIFTELTTKLDIISSSFSNMEFNSNLIYQSDINGLTLTGNFQENDVVESSIQNSSFNNVNMAGTSFIGTSLALSSFKGTDLSTTWFDSASGTDFYLVECDENTTLPIYNNLICRNNYLEFADDTSREFVLNLPNDKNRASYLYAGDADSFRLLVNDPASVAVEVTSKSSDIQFALRKAGSNEVILPTKGDSRTTARDDGTYTTTWKYFADFPALQAGEYYYVQVYGTEGIFYLISYYQER